MRIINIPNILTGLNLMSGCIASLLFLDGHYFTAIFFIGAALIFDFFDGFAARLLKISSPVGKELDSLADMVSFGFFPGVVLYVTLVQYLPKEIYLPYLGFVYTVFSAFRLAKFNLDTRQTENFIGMATPTGALFIIGLFFSIQSNFLGINNIGWIGTLLTMMILSYLLISEIPFFSLKLKKIVWKGNEEIIILIVLSIISLIFLKFNALILIIGAYTIYNVLKNLLHKN